VNISGSKVIHDFLSDERVKSHEDPDISPISEVVSQPTNYKGKIVTASRDFMAYTVKGSHPLFFPCFFFTLTHLPPPPHQPKARLIARRIDWLELSPRRPLPPNSSRITTVLFAT